MRTVIIVLLVLFAAGGGTWYACTRGNNTAPPVRTAPVEAGDLFITASATGTVAADVQVDVKSRASGEVIEVAVEAGDTVLAGDLLVRLDPTNEERKLRDAEAAMISARARLAQADAALASARANSAEEQAKAQRREAAYAAGLVSAEEVRQQRTAADVSLQTIVQREADIRSARAALEQANLTIADAQQRLRETTISAPVDGTVLSVGVERGSIVSSGVSNVGGGSVLLTLADLNRLYVTVKLDEAQIGAVRAGQDAAVRVDAYPQRTFSGIVERVTPLGTATSNVVTFDIKVLVTDSGAALLLPGMSADVEITTAAHRSQLLVPSAALRSIRGERFVVTAAGETVPVTTGATDGTSTVVTSGLREGDEVVIAGSSGEGRESSRGFNPFGGMRGGGRH